MHKKESLKKLKKEKKSFRSLLGKFLELNDTPERIALSFTIGVFIAFSPLLGTHLIMVFFLILIFRFNKIAILTGALVNNPWTILPMYSAGTFLGFVIMRKPIASLPSFKLSDFESFSVFFGKFKLILFPYLIGCTVLGLLAALISYVFIREFFVRRRRKKGEISSPKKINSKKKL